MSGTFTALPRAPVPATNQPGHRPGGAKQLTTQVRREVGPPSRRFLGSLENVGVDRRPTLVNPIASVTGQGPSHGSDPLPSREDIAFQIPSLVFPDTQASARVSSIVGIPEIPHEYYVHAQDLPHGALNLFMKGSVLFFRRETPAGMQRFPVVDVPTMNWLLEMSAVAPGDETIEPLLTRNMQEFRDMWTRLGLMTGFGDTGGVTSDTWLPGIQGPNLDSVGGGGKRLLAYAAQLPAWMTNVFGKVRVGEHVGFALKEQFRSPNGVMTPNGDVIRAPPDSPDVVLQLVPVVSKTALGPPRATRARWPRPNDLDYIDGDGVYRTGDYIHLGLVREVFGRKPASERQRMRAMRDAGTWRTIWDVSRIRVVVAV